MESPAAAAVPRCSATTCRGSPSKGSEASVKVAGAPQFLLFSREVGPTSWAGVLVSTAASCTRTAGSLGDAGSGY